MPAQHEVVLTISLLESYVRDQIVEQQEKLCKQLYSNNPIKFQGKDKTFAKIPLLNLSTII